MNFSRTLLIFFTTIFLCGCDILTAPFALLAQLIPIAIQYAPYALMFLEENPQTYLAENSTTQNFLLDLQQRIKEPESLPALDSAILEKIRQKKIIAIWAINLQSPQDVAAAQKLFVELSKQGQVHYCIAGFAPHALQMQTTMEALQKNNISIHATGTLASWMSVAQKESRKSE